MSTFAKAGYWKFKFTVYIEARSNEEYTAKAEKIHAIAAEKEKEG